MMEATPNTNPGFGDQLSIETPEQIALRMPLASFGSRLLAVFIDNLVQIFVAMLILLCFVLIVFAFNGTGGSSHMDNSPKAAMWGIAIFVLAQFLLYWCYFSLFEAFWDGKTPGKYILKIRVIKDTGRRITLFESMTRNLLRIVDMLPGMYLIGGVTMLCNKSGKRLGDLAAGTLVVHQGVTHDQVVFASSGRSLFPIDNTPSFTAATQFAPQSENLIPSDAVARLSSDDLRAIEQFFTRLLDLDLPVRESLSVRLAQHIAAKMQFALPEGMRAESFLESVAQAMRSRGR